MYLFQIDVSQGVMTCYWFNMSKVPILTFKRMYESVVLDWWLRAMQFQQFLTEMYMKMSKRFNKTLLSISTATLILAISGLASADATKIKGLITAVQGNTITIKDTNNQVQTITVSSDTKIHSTKGLTGAVFETVQQSALMPGLPISADVDNGVASKVSFKSEDFKTAQQVQAGLAPTDAQVAANTARMNDFGTYEVLDSADVLFASGSSAISSQGTSDLNAFATKAKATKDYMVIVQGFTDSTGNAAANQVLSDKRATAVTNYLAQKAGLQPGRIKAPDGLGIAPDAGSGSNAGARKVTVKLVVDKGVQDGVK